MNEPHKKVAGIARGVRVTSNDLSAELKEAVVIEAHSEGLTVSLYLAAIIAGLTTAERIEAAQRGMAPVFAEAREEERGIFIAHAVDVS